MLIKDQSDKSGLTKTIQLYYLLSAFKKGQTIKHVVRIIFVRTAAGCGDIFFCCSNYLSLGIEINKYNII